MTTTKKEWTIIFLVSAKSNLYYEMIEAINEIYSVGSTDEINYIIIFDGLEAGKFQPRFAKPSVYYADSGLPFLIAQPIKIYDDFDLTNEDHLSKIISEIKEQFPAHKYGFVYKGHGGRGDVDLKNGETIEVIIKIPQHIIDTGDENKIDDYVAKKSKTENRGLFVLQKRSETGSNNSVLVIYSNKNTRSLTHANINTVLSRNFDGKKELAFVFMDCCWAMQIENAYAYKNSAKYYIASADEMPALGLGKGYGTFCKKLNERPQIKYDEIADLLVSIYYTFMYNDYDQPDSPKIFNKMGVSLTSLDTSDLFYFTKAFLNFCKLLKDNMDEVHLLIAKARDNCFDFTYVTETEFSVYNIDLVWFLENLLTFSRADKKNEQLVAAILEVIRITMLYLRKSFMGANYQDPYPGERKRVCRGITITFPKRKEGLTDSYNQISPEKRGRVKFYHDTGWPGVLECYFATIEKYKKSTDEMSVDLKKKVAILLEKPAITKDIHEVTTEDYTNLIKKLQDTSDLNTTSFTFRKLRNQALGV